MGLRGDFCHPRKSIKLTTLEIKAKSYDFEFKLDGRVILDCDIASTNRVSFISDFIAGVNLQNIPWALAKTAITIRPPSCPISDTSQTEDKVNCSL